MENWVNLSQLHIHLYNEKLIQRISQIFSKYNSITYITVFFFFTFLLWKFLLEPSFKLGQNTRVLIKKITSPNLGYNEWCG